MGYFDNIGYEIRLVEENDAEFVVRIRTNPKLSSYINPTVNDVEAQKKWIQDYKKRETNGTELFFIFTETGHQRGTYRLSNINPISFTSGSWVFFQPEFKQLPKIADLIMNDFGFRTLGKQVLMFDIRKGNEKVIQSQIIKSPICYKEDATNYYYILTRDAWKNGKLDFMRYYDIDEYKYEEAFDALTHYYVSLNLSNQGSNG